MITNVTKRPILPPLKLQNGNIYSYGSCARRWEGWWPPFLCNSCEDRFRFMHFRGCPAECNSLDELVQLKVGGGGGGGGTYYTLFLISCFYHSENMYWVTLNVKIHFKEFLTPHNPPVHTP